MNTLNLFERATAIFRKSTPLPGKTPDMIELERQITDDWFRSHFVYSADTVNEWLSPVIDVRTSRVLDFGCGDGIMDLGMALRHQVQQITGIDLHDGFSYLGDAAKKQIGIDALPSNLSFVKILPGEPLASKVSVDGVFSWSVFEHIERQYLPTILADIFSALPKGGVFFLQIEPLYFSPHGSHLSGLISEPWAHLICSEQELFDQIDNKQSEQMLDEFKDKAFEQCSFNDFKEYLKREYKTLNKLTVAELIQLIQTAGFTIEKRWDNQTNLVVPPSLLNRYLREDLSQNEIRLLLRKP